METGWICDRAAEWNKLAEPKCAWARWAVPKIRASRELISKKLPCRKGRSKIKEGATKAFGRQCFVQHREEHKICWKAKRKDMDYKQKRPPYTKEILVI